ncbi:LysE family translocator [Sungkyunkwania multivorans]|uniref:LysE family translocator n=1 Tax=Sungkyunkwania multivorans TaxID=1173618 RepID=A0ABW3D6H2_9FLAO
MDIEIILSFLVASILLTLSPGPDNIYVLTQGMVHGKKYGIVTTLGLVSGILVHTTLVAFGVSAIIKKSETIFFVIKLLGALYLFYLAYQVIRSEPAIRVNKALAPRKDLFQLYRQGFIMNVLNPKVTIFFLAFFPSFLFSETLSNIVQFYVLGVLFMLQALLIFGLIAILAGTIAEFLKKHRNTGVVLKWMQIFVFIGIGVFILLSDQ